MKQARHQARILALQGLYQVDMQRLGTDADVPALLAPLFTETNVEATVRDHAVRLTAGAWSDHERYDQIITEASDHWDVSRMAVVDRNILRLALYELIEQPQVPARVVIDEAIELGREFGAADTPPFINGVLDAMWRRDPACRAARTARESKSASPQTQAIEEPHGTV